MRTRLTFLIRDLGYAGAQRQLVALAAGLPRDEFEISVLHFYPGPLAEELRAAGIKTVCVRKKSRWDLIGFFLRLLSAARAERPDILHSYLTESNVLGTLLKPFLPGTHIVWGLRDSRTDAGLWGILGRLSFRLSRMLSHRADRIIANSAAGRDYYISLGFPADHFSVIPNGIDVDRFVPAPDAGSKLRAEWKLTPDAFLFGHVGRLNAMKDHATLFRAATTVFGKHAHARIVCVGGGSEHDSTVLRRLAGVLDIADKVFWLPARGDMTAVYNAFDALVSSSSFGEGFSNVVAEAMSCGVPCVVTDVGDSASIVADTGYIAPPSQPEALAAAMCRLVETTPRARAELRMRVRARIVENFSTRQLVRRTRATLSELGVSAETAPLSNYLDLNA